MDLSEHFSWADVTFSSTAARLGIDNSLPEELKPVILRTATRLEKVRSVLGDKPIHVDSWYRGLRLNTILGSKPTSQHLKGEAVDFVCPAFGTPLDICRKLVESQFLIRFDQLILEHTWVHISFNSDPNGKQRGQVLSLLKSGQYALGLTNSDGVSYGIA